MIDKELEAKILRYHFVEGWGVNTIAQQVGGGADVDSHSPAQYPGT